jgi:hypothetical protein
MAPRKKLKIPDNQLRLIAIDMTPGRQRKPRRSRLARLEERVTHIEGDLALLSGQLEREEYIIDDEDWEGTD